MVDADDYESLPDSTPFRIVALAGAAAGVAEHCTMYPVDSVKVRACLTNYFQRLIVNMTCIVDSSVWIL